MQLSKQIYEKIKRSILSGEYQPNELITEQAIANMYGVSKTPAREALMRLNQEDYLDKYPRKGYFIRSMNLEEYADAIELRILIESEVVKKVIERATDEQLLQLKKVAEADCGLRLNADFHLHMASIAGNKMFLKTLEDTLVTVGAPVSYSMSRLGVRAGDDKSHHHDIVDALFERNEKKALRLLAKDIMVYYARVLQRFR